MAGIGSLAAAIYIYLPAPISSISHCFHFFIAYEEAKRQIPGPYNWKGKRRKDFYLTEGLRYYGKSRDLP